MCKSEKTILLMFYNVITFLYKLLGSNFNDIACAPQKELVALFEASKVERVSNKKGPNAFMSLVGWLRFDSGSQGRDYISIYIYIICIQSIKIRVMLL